MGGNAGGVGHTLLWLGRVAQAEGDAAAALLARGAEALVFDADWLLEPALLLVGRSLVEARDRRPAYGALWLRVLAMVARNGRTAVHFGRVTPAEAAGLRRQLRGVLVRLGWCRLDCDDAPRTARLAARGWTAAAIADALAIAQALRDQIPLALDTSRTTPEEAAALVVQWIRSHASPRPITGGNDASDEP